MKKLLILTFILFLANQIYSQTLTVTGGWSTSLATTNITEAGLNYPNGSAISATNQSLIRVNSAANSVAFVYIQKSDTSWDSRLVISARRTGNGTGSTNFSTTNGTTAQTISNVPQYFFEVRPGSGTQVSNIPIQYLISGFTVLLPVKAYTTTLIYTISN
jgi:hypothetical protein